MLKTSVWELLYGTSREGEREKLNLMQCRG